MVRSGGGATMTTIYRCGHTRETEQPRGCKQCQGRRWERLHRNQVPKTPCVDCSALCTTLRCRACSALVRWHGQQARIRQQGALLGAESRSLRETALRLGVRPDTAGRLLAKIGVPYLPAAQRAGGMAISDVMVALGVSREVVRKWGRASLCMTRVGVSVSISPNDLYDWLYAGGALLPTLVPTGEWAGHVRDARAHLEATTITIARLTQVLHATRQTIGGWVRRDGFPGVVVSETRGRAARYDRAAVAAWLRAHPDKMTTAARKEFGL